MLRHISTSPQHIKAAEEAAAILERTLGKTKKYPITREDDWSLTRALAALKEVPPVQTASGR